MSVSSSAASSRSRRGSIQTGIYGRDLGGQLPDLPANLLQLEELALGQLSDEARGYIVASPSASATSRECRTALDRWRIVPSMLTSVDDLSTNCELLGLRLSAPLLIAPVGVQMRACAEGELVTVMAAAAIGVLSVHTHAAAFSCEAIDAAVPDAARWSTFDWLTDEDVFISMLKRASAAGFTHLVLTVDTLVLGWPPTDLNRDYLPFLRGIGIADYTSDLAFVARIDPHRRTDTNALAEVWRQIFPNPGLTWNDLAFLLHHWAQPILLTGISRVDDALPEVVHAVDGRYAVLFDSGIRHRFDIRRAIALGAFAARVGCAFLYGLPLRGQAGVEHVLTSLLAEFDLALARSGHRSIDDINAESVRRVL